MNKQIIIIAALLFITTILTSCSKDKVNNPQPVEQELITTMRLVVTSDSGFNRTFTYKVENGFGLGTGSVSIDTLKLSPNSTYHVETMLFNETVTPVENTTEEILEENKLHLFLYISSPASGNGAVSTSDGSKDDNGAPFNQKVTLKTGDEGMGSLTITLKHEPTDKHATNPTDAGGETDAQAVYPVVIQ